MSAALMIDDCEDEAVEIAAATPGGAEGNPRTAFHAERLTGIGGSDAATVCGLSPYRTPYDLWLEKTGQMEPDDLSGVEAVTWGVRLESVVAQHFAETLDLPVRRNNRLLRSKARPYMIAHIDREIVGRSAILECKTVGAHYDREAWGASGTDMVPDHYLLQCQHYLAVTGREIADLAVLMGGQQFRWYAIPRDAAIIDGLVEREGAFWRCVESMTPPEIDYSAPGTLDLVKRLHPGTNGERVELGADAAAWHRMLQDAKESGKAAKRDEDIAKAAILDMMGDAAVGALPDGTAYTRKIVERGGYEVAPTSYVDFRHVKKVKD